MMIDLILLAVIVIILAAAAAYVYKAKKSGQKCIGCPDGCSCGKKQRIRRKDVERQEVSHHEKRIKY